MFFATLGTGLAVQKSDKKKPCPNSENIPMPFQSIEKLENKNNPKGLFLMIED
jgi:hypothetical protein